ncbi:MAG TPA: SOS response-associated peptidase family protein, partial [Bacteroidia bacterium]|nr:SOS response-associated peptidase family protein [Bacteroidia bacterium]
MIRSNIKRSIHDKGFAEALASLSPDEKGIWEEKAKLLAEATSGDEGLIDEETAEAKSMYPGAQVQVIPITTLQREYYNFGYLPGWAKNFKDHKKLYNARSDSLRIKPTWKKAWYNGQRCLVCAAGFWEDDRVNDKRYFFSVKGKEEIFFGGIFNHWKDPTNAQVVKTFAIITHEPNELLLSINHPRMPAILDENSCDIWLNANEPEPVVFDLILTYPA